MRNIKDVSFHFVVPPCFAHASRDEPYRVRNLIDTLVLSRALPSQPIQIT